MTDFETFKSSFKGDLLTPDDPGYDQAIARWAKNGSDTVCPFPSTPTSDQVSTAQKGMGTRIQLRPAPAIWAMSSSVMNVS
ncbi:hypothetical protein NUW54_g4266 [Trametes sanguinea]|uniref:Uncharacterized protein n=1 Tax=Trametes sanguinea TaxID=158606 RepID=A0ACC1Q034_9APHY|nr:hypothetical protein NUW54_g4266 [Trametes sanguinea]